MSSEKDVYFDSPPVVERVIGVQFSSLPGFHNGMLGKYWAGLSPEWGKANHAPLLMNQFERFGKAARWGGQPSLSVSQDPACRLVIRHSSDNRLIQIQNGRFHLNWKGDARKEYPRFTTLLEEFFQHFDGLRQFLSKAECGQLRMNQWEVTYLNHIPRGTAWSGPEDWNQLLACQSLAANAGGANLESFGGEWHYEIPEQLGRLHIDVRHARDGSSPGLDLLSINLTARGPILEDSDIDSQLRELLEGLGAGHKAIVSAFKDITHPAAHEYWQINP